MTNMFRYCFIAALAVFPLATTAQDQPPAQRTFNSPQAAADALVAACAADDMTALVDILGPEFAAEVEHSDDADEAATRARIAEMARQILRIEERQAGGRVALLGNELWPLPIPIMVSGSGWYFDTTTGIEEVLKRRIGRNELTAISVCRTYIEAQVEYAAADRDGDGILEYAQKIRSTPGTHDGLYWPVAEGSGEELSPLGPFVAEADNAAREKAKRAQGYEGYAFRILTGQGKHAPGKKFSYIDDKNMTAGFALIATPLDYAHSGVMTFIVNHLGAVYQQDFGPDTLEEASAITRFNPDESWVLVID